MSDDDEMPDWQWEIQRARMTWCGYDDLMRTIDCVDEQGRPFSPDAKYVRSAISLLEGGLDWPKGALGANAAAFIAALESGTENRAALLRSALDQLCENIGFTPAWNVLGTFELKGDQTED